jgi:predicted alpha/beta-hydrolase family hydrolase
VSDVAAEVLGGDRSYAGPVLLLAHGAGSRLDHPVHRGVAEAIASAGTTVVSFNFPYSEAGRRGPDPAARLLSCYRDVGDWVASRFPGQRMVGGGRSMGGRMASLLAAAGYDFAGLALLNYPLLAARGGAGSEPRTGHWPQIEVPVLFVHGTRDRLFPPDVYAASRSLLHVPVRLHVIEDADHVFAVPKRAGRTAVGVYAEVGDVVARWLTGLEVHA